MRTTACVGDVDLQVEANTVFDVDAAMEMDWNRIGEGAVGDYDEVLRTKEPIPRSRVRRPSPPPARGS